MRMSIALARLVMPVGGLVLSVSTVSGGRHTPGVTVTLRAQERSTSVCPGIDARLQELRRRVWLSWVQKRRPRNLDEHREGWVHDPPIDEETRGWLPLRDASLADQKDVWDKWTEPVVITMAVCTTPAAPAGKGRTGVCDFTITKSASKIVDFAAVEAIVAGRVALLPACVGDHEVDVRFEPWANADLVVDEAIAALSDDTPEVRGSAAAALGAIGPEARSAIGALERATKDPAKAVRETAKAALLSIRGR
jgi:hypothetical protein